MLHVWELLTFPTCIRSVKGQWNDVKCFSVNWDTWEVLSGAAGGLLKLWDLREGTVQTLRGSPEDGGRRFPRDMNCVSVDWSSRRAVVGAADGEVRLWDLSLEEEEGPKCLNS
mmetsp:Transcript_7657/g.19690  ORF Transcript_7657/g.19690 Transcript_7657/m.19690 type:complete len:113 (+) Transcript_7657:3-341(+)